MTRKIAILTLGVAAVMSLLCVCPQKGYAVNADPAEDKGNAAVATDREQLLLLPEPDRSAEDFVRVSLCIADPTSWRQDVLGTAGHAFLRLQCPYYSLDYCFSYEGERVNDNLHRYITGETKMGMFAVRTDEYIEDYRRWNRSVHEYFIDLPPEAEVRLWEIMDNHITDGITLRQDLNKYGCAITVVRYIKRALAGVPIVYAPSELDNLTRREIGYRSLSNHPWLRLTSMIFTDNRYDRFCPIDEKLIVPADLATVWCEATVEGRRMATYQGDLVSGAPIDNSKPWFTPMLLAAILLIITFAFAFTKYRWWDISMVVLQAIGGLVFIYLWIVMKEFGNAAYLVMALINPLPLLLWKWRKYWGLLYAALLLAGVVVLALLPHMMVDPAVLVLALSYIVIYSKDSIKGLAEKRRKAKLT